MTLESHSTHMCCTAPYSCNKVFCQLAAISRCVFTSVQFSSTALCLPLQLKQDEYCLPMNECNLNDYNPFFLLFFALLSDLKM